VEASVSPADPPRFHVYVKDYDYPDLDIERRVLEELAARSDIVHVNAPTRPETHHIVDVELLRPKKPTTVLVNGSRGTCVDNAALAEALDIGVIASAGLDDIEREPAKRVDWSPEEDRRFSRPNRFITPHVTSISEVSLRECRAIAAENAKAVLLGQRPANQLRS